jgi:enoyl-CoA hydratase/carnithine racemase
MSDLVLMQTDPDGGLAVLTLNRPAARNPVSIALLEALQEALARVAADPAVRSVILTGAGEAFCAGADLNEVRGDRETIENLLARLSHVMRAIHRLPLPTVAAVRGAAIGGGFGLMCAADFVLTHAEARIGYPALETGLCPAVMAPYLVRRIGPARARAMLLRGGTISGRAAHETGLVTDLADQADLDAAAHALAGELARGDRGAATRMKRFLDELDMTLDDEILDQAARVSAEVVASEETQRRLRAVRGEG